MQENQDLQAFSKTFPEVLNTHYNGESNNIGISCLRRLIFVYKYITYGNGGAL